MTHETSKETSTEKPATEKPVAEKTSTKTVSDVTDSEIVAEWDDSIIFGGMIYSRDPSPGPDGEAVWPAMPAPFGASETPWEQIPQDLRHYLGKTVLRKDDDSDDDASEDSDEDSDEDYEEESEEESEKSDD